jgi:hypothetical protein
MKEYSPIISFSKNSRGVYSIDPSIGCHSGATKNKRGCYSDCYAYRIAKIYGYDFSKTVFRDFESNKHLAKIKRQIRKINMPFIRMGTMGDPSENWDHTLYICKSLQTEQQLELFPQERKEIVIITKHWNNLSDKQLLELKQCKICINTSISVLDDDFVFDNSLIQFERIKPFCRSVLRVVSCNFNKNNPMGKLLSERQDEIFKKYSCLDTVFRPSKNNDLVRNGIINIENSTFLGKKAIISKFRKRTFLGKCNHCKEMCGINM